MPRIQVSPERMQEHLHTQYGYLARSAELFDLGYVDEAHRLALTLRVLCHDGRPPSVSLLTLLGVKDSMA